MDERKPLDIFICCGELSGDQIGADIIKNLPGLNIAGVIGPELRSLGVTEIAPMESLQMMGFTAVLRSLFPILKLCKTLQSFILKENPKALLLIDFSGFNTLLAKRLKKAGYKGKIIKVVCPQIWAWRKYRKKTIEKYHDALFTLFSFEKDLFNNSPLHTVHIGHPSAKKVLSTAHHEKLAHLKESRIIALFPGSRKKDIEINLPPQLRSVANIPGIRICISLSFEVYTPLVQEIAKQVGVEVTIVLPDDRFELMRLASMAVAKFGTISLELALSKTPTIMMIKLDPITATLLKYIFRISLPFYALPNILLKRAVFQEIILNVSGERFLHEAVAHLAFSSKDQLLQKQQCEDVIKIFEGLDPGERASQEILTLI